MKTRMSYVLALCCLTATLSLAQGAAGLEGTWVTEGVPAVEAAKKAKQSLNSLAEGTRIKFKVDAKKGKVSGTIVQLNSDKEYEIQDGTLTDKTFTFKTVESVPLSLGNSNRGGGGGFPAQNTPPPSISWKGELTDANTVTLIRLTATGEPAGTTLVLHRGK